MLAQHTCQLRMSEHLVYKTLLKDQLESVQYGRQVRYLQVKWSLAVVVILVNNADVCKNNKLYYLCLKLLFL